jgi:hypothetical protein
MLVWHVITFFSIGMGKLHELVVAVAVRHSGSIASFA